MHPYNLRGYLFCMEINKKIPMLTFQVINGLEFPMQERKQFWTILALTHLDVMLA